MTIVTATYNNRFIDKWPADVPGWSDDAEWPGIGPNPVYGRASGNRGKTLGAGEDLGFPVAVGSEFMWGGSVAKMGRLV